MRRRRTACEPPSNTQRTFKKLRLCVVSRTGGAAAASPLTSGNGPRTHRGDLGPTGSWRIPRSASRPPFGRGIGGCKVSDQGEQSTRLLYARQARLPTVLNPECASHGAGLYPAWRVPTARQWPHKSRADATPQPLIWRTLYASVVAERLTL